MLGIMLGGQFFRDTKHLQADKSQAAFFESGNDTPGQASFDAVGFDENEGAFGGHGCFVSGWWIVGRGQELIVPRNWLKR